MTMEWDRMLGAETHKRLGANRRWQLARWLDYLLYVLREEEGKRYSIGRTLPGARVFRDEDVARVLRDIMHELEAIAVKEET